MTAIRQLAQDELGSSITSSAIPMSDIEQGEDGHNSECEREGAHGGHTNSRQKPRGDHSTGTHTSVECDLEQESAPQQLSSPNQESIQDSDLSVHWNNVVSRVPVPGSPTRSDDCRDKIADYADIMCSPVGFCAVCFCGGLALFVFLLIWFKPVLGSGGCESVRCP
jgi:hypothetical protein